MLSRTCGTLNFVCEIRGGCFLLTRKVLAENCCEGASLLRFATRSQARRRALQEHVAIGFAFGNIDYVANEIHFSVETISRNSICCIQV